MRLFVYIFAFTATALLLGYGLFIQNGINPLAPEVRTIMLVSLAVAAYVGLRLAMLVRGFEQRAAERRTRGEETASQTGAFSRWGRSSSLDARLEARRERLRRAREAAESPRSGDEDGKTGSGQV